MTDPANVPSLLSRAVGRNTQTGTPNVTGRGDRRAALAPSNGLSTALAPPIARLSSAQARRTAARDLLAASQGARRVLEVITVYERQHGDEPLRR